MEGPELNQIFYTLGIIFLVILTGASIWTSIAIVKTLKIIREFIAKLESSIDNLSFVKDGLKQGIYSLFIKLIERIDSKPKKKGGDNNE